MGCCFSADAQDAFLPKDEKGKFTYYEVVEKQTSIDSLKHRLKNFLSKRGKVLKLKSNTGDTSFTANGTFLIAKTKTTPTHPSGEIQYGLNVDLKKGKYRFWLTDFNFIPYQRDRYGNFTASTTVGRPLESSAGMLNASQWKEIRQQTAAYSKVFAVNLKDELANATVHKTLGEIKTIKKDWK